MLSGRCRLSSSAPSRPSCFDAVTTSKFAREARDAFDLPGAALQQICKVAPAELLPWERIAEPGSKEGQAEVEEGRKAEAREIEAREQFAAQLRGPEDEREDSLNASLRGLMIADQRRCPECDKMRARALRGAEDGAPGTLRLAGDGALEERVLRSDGDRG